MSLDDPRNMRVPVYQRGRLIGSLPYSFHTATFKSKSFLYDQRPGDFKRTRDGGWEVANSMGPGDLEAIPGFVWERNVR